jgi:hypothetical protein
MLLSVFIQNNAGHYELRMQQPILSASKLASGLAADPQH